jgi:predicted transcriptional regulator
MGTSMTSIRSKITARLKEFVELDVSGLRTYVLSLLLNVKKSTVDELHKAISKKFDVSRSAVGSMVGYINSKLGILHSHKESYKTPMVYSLKEEYVDLIQNVLASKNTYSM